MPKTIDYVGASKYLFSLTLTAQKVLYYRPRFPFVIILWETRIFLQMKQNKERQVKNKVT